MEDFAISKVDPSVNDMFLLFMSLNLAAVEQLPVGLEEGEAKQFIADFVYKSIPTEMVRRLETYTFKYNSVEIVNNK